MSLTDKRNAQEIENLMNRMSEAQRIERIRERVREKADLGLLGPLAAQARVPEYVLAAWAKNAADVPTREMLVDIALAIDDALEIAPGRMIGGCKECDE